MIPTVDLDFTAPPPIPASGIARANELMTSGRLFRYGETEAGELDVADLEATFAALLGVDYCVALNSCGAALAVALDAAGVGVGDPVLINAFTLAPVPGAIARLRARPELVAITEDLVIDQKHLRRVAARTDARVLLLSHMRGHIADLDAVAGLADELGLTLIEDCAHTMGATWNGRPTGTFGRVGVFSTQTFKHVNSGEGGLLVTDDPDIAARAILHSGSYELHAQHGTVPPPDAIAAARADAPNYSQRMSALTAAVARPQLDLLAERAAIWNARHDRLSVLLGADDRVRLPIRPAAEGYVASSIQFRVPRAEPDQLAAWVDRLAGHGVVVKWFGRDEARGFTSRFDQWARADRVDDPQLAATAQILSTLCDMRIPLTMTETDADTIAEIVLTTLPT